MSLPQDAIRPYICRGSLFSQYAPLTRRMGAHRLSDGSWHFSVFAPHAKAVSLIGDFNGWDPLATPMTGAESGVWSVQVPGLTVGQRYKFHITARDGQAYDRADPCAAYGECPPGTASRLWHDNYRWHDKAYLEKRAACAGQPAPLAVYEVHLGSWREKPFPLYLTAAAELAAYAKEYGFTHVELMPIAEHPFDGSWGYQTTGFYAPTARYGTPEDFKYFVDTLHRAGIGVIVDWVAAHFPRDAHGLRRFDGDPLFENDEDRIAEHPEWGTLRFEYGKLHTKDFLWSNALYWFSRFHIDGLRVDAVSTMLYLDYGRQFEMQNRWGTNENADAIAFFRGLNQEVTRRWPGAMMIAEEATAYPMVTGPVDRGGLGFTHKWNMGWMNDTLAYMETDPLFRGGVHNRMTFPMVYAFHERFILPLSHDEVVHGKKSLLDKMPGNYWEKFASLRTYLTYQYTVPGGKLLFMGGEFGQFIEWRYYEPLEWKLLSYDAHRQLQDYFRVLGNFYRETPALWRRETGWDGFSWSNPDDTLFEVLSYFRTDGEDILLCILNMTPMERRDYLVGTPYSGTYTLVVNSDDPTYFGAGRPVLVQPETEDRQQGNHPHCLKIHLPPLATLIYRYSKPQSGDKRGNEKGET